MRKHNAIVIRNSSLSQLIIALKLEILCKEKKGIIAAKV